MFRKKYQAATLIIEDLKFFQKVIKHSAQLYVTTLTLLRNKQKAHFILTGQWMEMYNFEENIPLNQPTIASLNPQFKLSQLCCVFLITEQILSLLI